VQITVLRPITKVEVYSTCNLGASNRSLLSQTKKIAKEIEVRFYANIGLAQMDKSENKKDCVRVRIANPDLVIQKKTLNKRMNRHPKTPLEEILEHNDLTGAGVGELSPSGALQPPSSGLCSSPMSTRSPRDFAVLRDFFHSLAISSALFLDALFATGDAEVVSS